MKQLSLMSSFYKKKLLIFIILFLIIIPFLWLKPGEMDLGGDSTRLYFYDPINFLKQFSLYGISPQGFGFVEPNYYYLPFFLLLAALKKIFISSYVIISLFNSLKLAGGFLCIYFIIKELLQPGKKDAYYYPAILGGLFYIFSSKIIQTWDKALLSHNQIFLNPLMFYLLLRFFKTSDFRYAWILLAVSFVFSPNFSLTAAPPFFAFYPLAILFLLIYVIFVLKRKIAWSKVFATGGVFLLLQSFQLIPQIVSLLDAGSFTNVRVFDKESIVHEGVRYFTGVLPLAKASSNFLLPSTIEPLGFLSVVAVFILLLGFYFNKSRTMLLTGIFFIITFFLLTANITDIGVMMYEKLFYIPGFSMFRNFIGQWIFVFTFFYALLLGQAAYSFRNMLPKRMFFICMIFIIFLIFISAWQFINGSLVNKIHSETKNTKIAIRMDPQYEQFLEKVNRLPGSGKIFTFPFSDSYYQVLSGESGGAYIGLSTISYLTDKNDFFGYQVLTAPFSEELLKLARNKDYQNIQKMFSILSVAYIFHNEDPKIYDTTFPGGPYQYVRQSLPNSQQEYRSFIAKLGYKKYDKVGNYVLYKAPKSAALPLFYAASAIRPYTASSSAEPIMSFLDDAKNVPITTAFINKELCTQQATTSICSTKKYQQPTMRFQKVSPVRYQLTIEGSTKPFILVFQNAYHTGWKIFPTQDSIQGEPIATYSGDSVYEFPTSNPYFDMGIIKSIGKKPISDKNHVQVNGYANAWLIDPKEIGKNNFQLSVEMTGQRLFYYSSALSLITGAAFILWGIHLFSKRKNVAIIKNTDVKKHTKKNY